jgi:hypothetical protein
VKRERNGTDEAPVVLFRDDLTAARAVERRAQLLGTLEAGDFDRQYREAHPDAENRYSFRPQAVSAQYKSWPSLDSLSELRPSLGILENRQEALIDVDKPSLESRMRQYFDGDTDWETLRGSGHPLTKEFARFDPKKTREKLLNDGGFSSSAVRELLVRPMDLRWCYYTDLRPLWNEPRPAYVQQMWKGNRALVSRRKGVASPEGVPFFITSSIGYQHSMNTDAYFFPLRIKFGPKEPKDRKTGHLIKSGPVAVTANLSQPVRAYLRGLGISDPDADEVQASVIWMHALAIGYSSAFLSENADGIRQDWPHIPLPTRGDLLLVSADLGTELAGYLDAQSPADGVTVGSLRPEMRTLGIASRIGGGPLSQSELGIVAGWGHAGQNGVTMPGQGKLIERDYSGAEREVISSGARGLSLSVDQIFSLLGSKTCDVYLNDVAYWANIPANVWSYTIGGYQVIKKWLSYREQRILGRALTKEEVRYVQEMVRRIAAILLLAPSLDSSYEAVKGDVFSWIAE